MALPTGTRLGHYEIVSPIGAGGMGVVYKARDTRLDRLVAIKVLTARYVENAQHQRRFEQEARAVALLQHPNILVLHDVGTHDGSPYLVSEFLEGETLRVLLSRGPLALRKALEYGCGIAHGLAAAHDKGIAHRDLKPENILITKAGLAKILDFGLAKLTDSQPAGSQASQAGTLSELSQSGVVMGTVGYMSPEQVRGEEVDARSDIFSFGAVLYEMVSGRRAFKKGSPAESQAAILQQDPPELWSAGAVAPPGLELVVKRCLEKDRARRFQSAHDLAFSLETLGTLSGPITATGVAPRRGRWAWALAFALLLAIGAAVIAPSLRHGDVAPAVQRSMRFEVAPPPGSGFESGIALARDGSQLAFVAPGPQGEDLLWVRPLGALVPRALAGTEDAAYPFWSPDGRRLAFFAKGKLKTVDLAGGQPQTLSAASNPRGGAWSDGGVLLVSLESGARIARVPDSGGALVTVVGGTDVNEAGGRFPEFLPDGHRFLYYRFAVNSQAGVWVGDLNSPERQFLLASDSAAVYASPGFLVFRRAERLLAQRFDAGSLRLVGTPTTLAEDVWWNGTSTLLTPVAASQTGVLAFRTGGPELSQLVWFDRPGHSSVALGPPGLFFEPAISPDGRRIAVTRAAADDASVDIWLLDAERGGLARFTSGRGLATTPVWSPDGRQIAYSAFPTGRVLRKDASGIGDEELLWNATKFAALTDWSRDATTLFLCEIDFRTSLSDVTRVLLSDRRRQPLLAESFTECGARLSPDGRFLAYESDESGIAEVIVRSYPDLRERWPISTGGGTQPRWRGDGRELYFVAPDRRLMAVEFQTSPRFAPRLPRALFATHILPLVEQRNQYDVSADGQRFLVNSRRPEDATQPIVVLIDWAAGLPRDWPR